ncbi:hypothetical protein ACFL0W_02305 [Nanoarchaeota archaeon]
MYHFDSIKKYGSFSLEEVRAVLIGSVLMGFMFSFSEWGLGSRFDFGFGMRNFLAGVIIAMIALFFHILVQKIIGVLVAFKVEYRIWFYGLLIGLIISFISNGRLFFLAPGGIVVYLLSGHRLGAHRYGINVWPLGALAMCGPLMNFVMAMAVKALFSQILGIHSVFLDNFVSFNLWLAFFTILPIPPLPGSNLFFASRLVFVFVFGSLMAYAVLYALGIYSLIFAILIGFILYLLFYFFVESEIYK